MVIEWFPVVMLHEDSARFLENNKKIFDRGAGLGRRNEAKTMAKANN